MMKTLIWQRSLLRSIHHPSSSPQSDVYHCNRVISDHIRAGDLPSALKVFHNMEFKSIVTWNSILSGYSKRSLQDARNLFNQIPQPDSFSYNTMLNCYVHHRMTKQALHFFNTMPFKDASSWNIVIKSFLQAKNMKRARELFDSMPEKTPISWNAMISGYLEVKDVDSAQTLFESAPCKNVITWTAMISGYMKRGDLRKAENLFDEMPERNLVSWNAMIAGYVHNCRAEEGVILFKTMMGEGFKPNQSTFSTVLLACSELASSNLGRQIHQLVVKSPFAHDTTAGTSLVGMYGKCGELSDAWKQFDAIPTKDVVSWNAVISAYAQHGEGVRALQLFDEMGNQSPKQNPDAITLVAIILACDHAGLVELGQNYFTTMTTKYNIKPNREHYTCMINLLGRAGKISEAFELIDSMPYEPYPALYGSLLGACRVHKNSRMAEIAAGKLLELNPGCASAYVELANVYAAIGDWEEVGRVRKEMKKEDVVKTPGYSWIEIGRVVHRFRSGEREHAEMEEIRAKVREVDERARIGGYVADVSCALRKVGDEEKREILMHHSERLALAYGLMKLPRRTRIQVFKNLRICGDCHTLMKYVSRIEKREIMVRDSTRFHRFKDGRCSCADYW